MAMPNSHDTFSRHGVRLASFPPEVWNLKSSPQTTNVACKRSDSEGLTSGSTVGSALVIGGRSDCVKAQIFSARGFDKNKGCKVAVTSRGY
jgi:hypothetical protein